MHNTDLAVFEDVLTRLREANTMLDDTDAGVCMIHLDACIAALESRIRRHGMTKQQQQGQAANDAALILAKPLSGARDPR